MNFELTQERRMLQDGLRRMLKDHAGARGPAAAAQDPQGHNAKLWADLVGMGIPGAMFTEAQGGFGGSGFDIMVVFEELGRAGVFEPVLDSAVLAGGLLEGLGHGDLTETIIGGVIVTLAHGEPGSRYDLAHVETRARPGADGYRITGRKALVHFAAPGRTLLVTARTFGETGDENGISLFAITGEARMLRDYALQGGGRAAEVTLDTAVPRQALIGPEGGAFPALEHAHARATAALCAEALGLMEAIRDLTVEYLKTRKQFGQPIGKFQALQHRMADVLIEIEQARSAVINLCGHLDAARPIRERHVSATKNLIGRAARLVIEEAIQMHGGIGMTQDYALGHLAKRLTMIDHRFGDADHHLERFIRLSAAQE